MPLWLAMDWIERAASQGIGAIRLTGGEPTLHPDIIRMCRHAKRLNRRVILNTNGMAATQKLAALFELVDDVRVSLPCLNPGRLDAMTGAAGALERKKSALALALGMGLRACALTVLTPELHGSLDEFARFVRAVPGLEWGPMRFEPTPALPRPWSRRDVQLFAEEVSALMGRYPDQVRGIFMAVPFCAVTPLELGVRVFRGRAAACGPYASLSVDARGWLTACPGGCELPGPGSLEDMAQNRAVRERQCLDALAPECRECPHVAACAGGCGKPEALVPHRGGAGRLPGRVRPGPSTA